ncbi:MAG TPA: catalase family peroxidase [Acidimicrobiia bacterium]|nr:catalase family peroxidase [Acidimicrobiia bacterium]
MGPDEQARRAIDAINAVSGGHSGHRAAHAKGTLCAATFTPTPEARSVSRAAHLGDGPVRAHVRFSNGSGDPAAPDFEPREGRGMATKFYLPDGTTTDIVGITLPAFFVNTVDGFFDFCRARTPDPATGEPDPAAIGTFLEQHPEALTAGAAVLAATPPESYLRCTYNSLHAYRFVDGSGNSTFGRYRWEPEAGESAIALEDAEARGPDYLQDDLARRLSAGPAGFTLGVQIAEDRDPVHDPSIPFPDERPWITLGRIEITGLAHDREQGDDVLVFDPTRVTDGIELSDDPILRFRTHAYAESVLRRTGVARDPV